MKRCIYCSSKIIDERAVEICDSCGEGVWGKMFKAIKQNMGEAREKGDLFQGSIIDNSNTGSIPKA